MVLLDMDRLMYLFDWLVGFIYIQCSKYLFIIFICIIMVYVLVLKVKWIIEKFGVEELLIFFYVLKEGVFRFLNYIWF